MCLKVWQFFFSIMVYSVFVLPRHLPLPWLLLYSEQVINQSKTCQSTVRAINGLCLFLKGSCSDSQLLNKFICIKKTYHTISFSKSWIFLIHWNLLTFLIFSNKLLLIIVFILSGRKCKIVSFNNLIGSKIFTFLKMRALYEE